MAENSENMAIKTLEEELKLLQDKVRGEYLDPARI